MPAAAWELHVRGVSHRPPCIEQVFLCAYPAEGESPALHVKCSLGCKMMASFKVQLVPTSYWSHLRWRSYHMRVFFCV